MKKKQTAEEKLRAALVPEAEQPYALPKKWCWVRLGSISQESKNKSNNFSIPNLKYVGLENLEKDKGISSISSASNIKSQKNVFQQGDILYGKLRPYLNKHDVAQFSGICSTDIIVLKSLPLCLNLYLNYFFNLNFFISYAVNNSKGINLPRLSPNSLMMAQFPLAPFPEQKRISNIINNLFNKLDEAKEKVEQVLDTFETRKAAILHAAFTGKLTEQWRKERGVGEETWRHTFLKDICLDIKVGIVIKPSQYYTDSQHGVPAFRSANVREFYVNDSDWVYIDERGQKDNQRTLVHEGDVLIVRSGNPGTACVVPHNCDGYGAIDILIAVPNNKLVIPEYLCAFTNSPLGKKLVAENKRGMALAHFNVKGYSNLPIFLPTLEEQRKIVNIATTLLAKEQQAKDLAEAQLAQIDTLKKSILARAFRGELGTSRQSDRSALDELKAYFAGEGES